MTCIKNDLPEMVCENSVNFDWTLFCLCLGHSVRPADHSDVATDLPATICPMPHGKCDWAFNRTRENNTGCCWSRSVAFTECYRDVNLILCQISGLLYLLGSEAPGWPEGVRFKLSSALVLKLSARTAMPSSATGPFRNSKLIKLTQESGVRYKVTRSKIITHS